MAETFTYQELDEEKKAINDLLNGLRESKAISFDSSTTKTVACIRINQLLLKNLPTISTGSIQILGKWEYELINEKKSANLNEFKLKAIVAQVDFIPSEENSVNKGIGWHFDFQDQSTTIDYHPRCHLQFAVTKNRQVAGGMTNEANNILPRIPHHMLTPILFLHWILYIYKQKDFRDKYQNDGRWKGIAKSREKKCFEWYQAIFNGMNGSPWIPFIEAVEKPW